MDGETRLVIMDQRVTSYFSAYNAAARAILDHNTPDLRPRPDAFGVTAAEAAKALSVGVSMVGQPAHLTCEPYNVSDLELCFKIDRVRFKAATSARYKDCPHEYIMEEWGRDYLLLCVAMHQKILSAGYKTTWGKWEYRYYHLNGFKYWVIEDCLNREQLT